MIKLYHFGQAWNVADPSPFCLKVMAYMTLADIPFESMAGMSGLRGSPKKKLPYIEDGDKRLGDSTFIVEYLEATYPNRLATVENPRLRAELHALRRMLEENTYWALVTQRWLDDSNWEQHTRPQFFGGLAWPLSTILPGLLRSGLRKTVYRQGMGRHSREEIDRIAQKDLQAVADLLGDRRFVAGDDVTVSDATVYAFLHSCVGTPHRSAQRDFVTENRTLSDYLKRMLDRLGPAFSAPAARPTG